MDDIWYQKLLLPTLDGIPPPVLASILNCWYEKRNVTREEQLQPFFVSEHEIMVLNFLKKYATHTVLGGTLASMAAKQISYREKMWIFIPVYENIDKYFVPTLDKMMAKAKANSSHTSQIPGLKELLEFSWNIISSQNKNTMVRLYSQQIRAGKFMRKKFIEFNYKNIQVRWIEVPLDPCSFFVKYVPLCTLFLFYLLAGTIDIPTLRIAILDWKYKEVEEDNMYATLYVTDTLHLIYRLPGYDEHILRPESHLVRFTVLPPHPILLQTRPRYYERRLALFQEESKRVSRYSNYLYANDHPANLKKHPCHCIPSLSTLCLSILVSLSDLFWMKYKQYLPFSKYMNFAQAKRKVTLEIQRDEPLKKLISPIEWLIRELMDNTENNHEQI